MQNHNRHLLHPAYRPDIDGLRAIAVLTVVGYHAAPGWVPGGFVGVDIFFVISGFLISTIIFGNLERNNFSYLEFYERRIKRIFPALVLVLASTLIFGWYISFSSEFEQLGKHVAGGAGFISNIVFWSEAGYFDNEAETKPLLHLWSLGVEEQFYVVWPLLLGFVWSRKIGFLYVTIFIAVLSFAISIYSTESSQAAAYFSPLSRFWELMVGGILAYVMLHRSGYQLLNATILSFSSLFGLLLVVISFFVITKYSAFPGWWALIPTMGTVLVIAGNTGSWVNRYFLSNRFMVSIGLISYPLYLWHWPLLSYAQILEVEGNTPSRSIRATAIIASFALAWLTYVLVEKRFKRGYSKVSIYVLSILMVALLILGVLAWQGFLSPRHKSDFTEMIVTAVGDWDFPGDMRPIQFDNTRLYVKEGGTNKTLFIGDSHMQQYGPRVSALLEADRSLNTAVFVTEGGCPFITNVHKNIPNKCQKFRETAEAYLQRDDVETVVIGGNWNAYFIMETREDTGGQNPVQYYYQGSDNVKHMFRNGDGSIFAMDELERMLARLAADKSVYLLLDNPFGAMHSPRSLFKGSRLSQIEEVPASGGYTPYPQDQKILREKLKKMASRVGAKIIDPTEYLCSQDKCQIWSENGEPIYKDASHLRPFFTRQHAEYIDMSLQ